jgi:uncharacterized membrane protein
VRIGQEGSIVDFLPLLGVVVVVVGLVLRLNPLIVVLTAGIVTGLIAHMEPLAILAAIGRAVTTNRLMLLFILVLPVVGLLERHGLRERAEILIRSLQRLTSGGILFGYLLARQISAAFGLPLGGHPQFIRPLIAPMAEAAAQRDGAIDEALAERVKATAAAAENVGNFFGQMIFLAASGLLLIKGTLDQAGHPVSVEAMALWAIPTAVVAFLISIVRFFKLDRDIKRAGRQPGRDHGGEARAA